jgi:hypothetical protein
MKPPRTQIDQGQITLVHLCEGSKVQSSVAVSQSIRTDKTMSKFKSSALAATLIVITGLTGLLSQSSGQQIPAAPVVVHSTSAIASPQSRLAKIFQIKLQRSTAHAQGLQLAQACEAPSDGYSYCGIFSEQCVYCKYSQPHYCPSTDACYDTIAGASAACGQSFVVCGRPVG